MSENAQNEDMIKKLEYDVDKLKTSSEEEIEKQKKKARSARKKIDELTNRIENDQDINKNPALKKAFELCEQVEGLGDYTFNIRKDLDDVIGSVKKLTNVLKTMKQDQIKSLANTRAVLCLSCGRGDVNFMPPNDYVRGEDGRFYKTDFVIKNNQVTSLNNPDEEYDYGTDVFTRHEIVKEHTLKSHLPVDLIMQHAADPKVSGDKIALSKKIRPMSAIHGISFLKNFR